MLGDVEDLSSECKEQLTKRTNNVSNKITEIVNLQQNTSGDLCEIQEKVLQMNEEVDKAVEEQVLMRIEIIGELFLRQFLYITGRWKYFEL